MKTHTHHHPIRTMHLLCAATIIGSIVSLLLCIAMLWALLVKPAWPFVVIGLMALITADLGRCHAMHMLRLTRQWKNPTH
jgi:uncharacterized membrane protein